MNSNLRHSLFIASLTLFSSQSYAAVSRATPTPTAIFTCSDGQILHDQDPPLPIVNELNEFDINLDSNTKILSFVIRYDNKVLSLSKQLFDDEVKTLQTRASYKIPLMMTEPSGNPVIVVINEDINSHDHERASLQLAPIEGKTGFFTCSSNLPMP